MTNPAAKALDHLVLPVPSLPIARKRLSDLGFSVAADGHHPFGTSNACVFFADETYLEPLAVGDRDIYQAQADAGNPFVARDRTFRSQRGDDGISLIALRSANAEADATAYRRLGYGDGEVVEFSRDVVLPDDAVIKIGVKLGVAELESAPELALFSCQWLSKRRFDTALTVHPNTATGTETVAVLSDFSVSTTDYLTHVIGLKEGLPDTGQVDCGAELVLPNARIKLYSPTRFEAVYGWIPRRNRTSLTAHAIDIKVTDLATTTEFLMANGVEIKAIDQRIIVAPGEGQGYAVAFIQETGS